MNAGADRFGIALYRRIQFESARGAESNTPPACCWGASVLRPSDTLKDGTQTCSWHCAAPAGVCDNVSIKDANMKTLVADALGLNDFDEASMDKQIEYAQMNGNTVTFHFRDGHEDERNYKDKHHGTKWTAERREKQCQALKACWTADRRAAMSEKRRKQERCTRMHM